MWGDVPVAVAYIAIQDFSFLVVFWVGNMFEIANGEWRVCFELRALSVLY